MVGDHNNSYELLIHYTNKFSFLVRFALETKKEFFFLVKRDNKKQLKNRTRQEHVTAQSLSWGRRKDHKI